MHLPKAHCVACLLLACLFLFTSQLYADIPLPFERTQNGALPSLAPVVEEAMPAIVNIATQSQQKHKTKKQTRKIVNLGSGILIDAKKGYLVTNFHVVRRAQTSWVTLNDGRQIKGELIGGDAETDVALIKIKAKNLTALPLFDSEKVRVGDFVLALGSPFGLKQTVTSGIVSGIDRSNLGIRGFEDFIQTDASINPGNSGGALINLRGELIGMNTAILSRSGGNIGVGFAIPSNMVFDVVQQLIKHGDIKRGTIGITVRNLSAELAKRLQLPSKSGALIVDVTPDSPAAKSGLKTGDVITTINKKPIKHAADLRNVIGLKRLGSAINIDYIRKGKPYTTQFTLSTPVISAWPIAKVFPPLSGAYVSKAPPSPKRRGGVEIVKLTQSSRAYTVGLRKGDIILTLNKHPISDLNEFRRLLQRFSRGDIMLYVQRDKRRFYLVMRRL